MTHQLCTLLLLSLGLNLTLAASLTLERGLYDLDELLTGTTKSSDSAKVVLEKAKTLLESIRDSRPQLMASAELFLSLERLDDATTCNAEGFEIVKKFNEASRGLAKYGLRLVDRVGFEYLVNHAKRCEREYLNKFQQIQSALDQSKRRQVEELSTLIVQNSMLNGAFDSINPVAVSLEDALQSSPLSFITLMDTTERDPHSELEMMKKVLRNHINSKGGAQVDIDELDRPALEHLFNEQIHAPCAYYDEQLGDQVYRPMLQDHSTLQDDRRSRTNGRLSIEAPLEFYLAMAHLKACHLYVLDVDREKLLRGLSNM